MANVSSSNGLEKYPKLRFPGFDDPWVPTAFGDLIEEFSERTKIEDEDTLLSAAIEGMFLNTELFGHQRGASNKGYKKIRRGTMVLSTQNLHLGNANVNLRFDHGMVSPAYKTFEIQGCAVDLMAQWIKSEAAKRFFYNATTVGASICRRNVEWETLYEQDLYLPSMAEQEKIASFLTLLNNRISRQQQFVAALKKYKRGVMHHIFHQHDAQSDKAWTCVRLGDVFKKVSRRNTNGMVKNVITNSAEYGLIPQREFFDKDIAVDGNTANYYVIEEGDFVYNPRKSNTAPYGPFNRYTLSERGIISPLYTCLVLQTDINPSYLAWYFRSDAWHRYIYDNGSQGVRHDRVSMTDDLLMGIPVMFPDHTKQQVYADVLDKVEARLQTAQKEYDLLIKTKNGYVQQLFI